MTTPRSRPTPTQRSVPLPRQWRINAIDVIAILVANGVIILAMWLRHDGLDQLSTLGGQLTAVGQLTGLFAAYLALIQLVLMARSPLLDQVFGMDGLAAAHRWLGFATVWLLVAHGLFIVTGYALGDGRTVVEEVVTLVTTYPYVLMAIVSGALFGMVAVSSVRAARRRLSYETWYGLHLYAYLAIALGFLHQVFVGADFIHDPIAVGYWVALYVIAAAFIVVFRIGQPVWLSARHRLRVASVVAEAPGVYSVYVTGRDLDQLAVRSGQYFLWRFLTRDGWWRAHPFSISSAPNGAWLRITIKELGDWSSALQRLAVGTRVFIEGPYGVLTGARRTRPKVLLIAGGIGITPLRALLEALPANPGDLTLLYRVRSVPEIDLPHRARCARPAAWRAHPLSDRSARDRCRRSARCGVARPARARCRGSGRLPLRAGPDDGARRGVLARPRPPEEPGPRRALRVLRAISQTSTRIAAQISQDDRLHRSLTPPSEVHMTESNDSSPIQPVPTAPLTPLTHATTVVPGLSPITSPEPGVAFHERVTTGRGRARATRVGIITGSALLVLVGVAAAMGASPSPSNDPTSAVGADPSASASAPAPAASADPNAANPNGTKPDHVGTGGPRFGFGGGFPGIDIGFRDISITAIDGSSLSLKTEDGWTRTITVTDSTAITKGGATIGLGDLAVGDSIRFRQEKASDGTYTVTAIVVVLPTVVGQISAIDGNTITVTQLGDTTATIHVGTDTTYRLAGGSGGAGSLSDLKVGMVIVAEGTQRSDGSLDAASVRAGLEKGTFRGPGFGAKPGFPDGVGPHDDARPSPAPTSGAS